MIDIMTIYLGIVGLITIVSSIYKHNLEKKRVDLYREKCREELEEVRRRKKEEEEFKDSRLFREQESKDLANLWEAREKYIYEMLKQKFDKEEMSFQRYDKMIKTCKKYFYKNLEISDNQVIRVNANESYIESITKCKELLKGIDKLMVELIKYGSKGENIDFIVEEINEMADEVKTYYAETDVIK